MCKKTAWKNHLYVLFYEEPCLKAPRLAPQELRVPQRTLRGISLPRQYTSKYIVHIYIRFGCWNGWILLFSSWEVLIFSNQFFCFPQTRSDMMKDPSMRTVHFQTGFSNWFIVIWCLVFILHVQGTWISCFFILICSEQQNMVMESKWPCAALLCLYLTLLVYFHFYLHRRTYMAIWCGLNWGEFNFALLGLVVVSPWFCCSHQWRSTCLSIWNAHTSKLPKFVFTDWSYI